MSTVLSSDTLIEILKFFVTETLLIIFVGFNFLNGRFSAEKFRRTDTGEH